MLYKWLFILMTLPLLGTPEEIAQRVNAHLLIGDIRGAFEEAQVGVNQYPTSQVVLEANIRALARTGNEQAMVDAWNRYRVIFPEQASNRDLLEHMAWGTIDKASQSSSVPARLIGLLAAFFSQDIKGVKIIERHLRDSNCAIRAAAASLAGRLPDAKLADRMEVLFKEEKAWAVRLEAIKAIGTMRITRLRPELEALVASSSATAEEKAAATQSLVTLLDTSERSYVKGLAQNNRMGLRLLACQVVAYFSLLRDTDLIIGLTCDPQAPVRSAALQTLGVIRPKGSDQMDIAEIARSRLGDPDPEAAISAAWLLTLYSPEEGQAALKRWLVHEIREVRLYAAGALAATSHYGSSLLYQTLEQTTDGFVKVNLALGLIGQRQRVSEACEALFFGLSKENGKWMWEQSGIFRYIAPNDLGKDNGVANSPEAQNQVVRLEILNILATLSPERALGAVRSYLKEKSWGVSAVAVALLLTEGDDTALSVVKQLLDDPDPHVRIQAALVLALWGRDEAAMATLQKAYPTADRETKERILEGVGRVGSMDSIPFLVEALDEPFQHLRVIVAAALIQCLNH